MLTIFFCLHIFLFVHKCADDFDFGYDKDLDQEDFNAVLDEDKTLAAELTNANFGSGGGSNPSAPRTHKEIMKEVIAKSKLHKMMVSNCNS